MEAAVVALSVACAVMAVGNAACVACIPFLWWQVGKLRQDVDKLDEVLDNALEASNTQELKR